MRLINGDKLLEIIAEQERWNVPDFVYESIKEAPTIDAEPVKHGKWVYKEFEPSKAGFYVCSECGYVAFNEKSCHYCYHCGAKMDEVEGVHK